MKMCGTPLDFTGTFLNKLGEADWMGWVSCDEVKDNRTLPGLDNSQGSFWEARGVKPLACEAKWIGIDSLERIVERRGIVFAKGAAASFYLKGS
jgi:hypothetical protein